MRSLLFFLPVILMAQVSPPKPQAARTKARPSAAAKKAAAVAPPLATDDEKTIYSLGLSIYRSLAQFDLSPSELAIVKRAMTDAAAGKPAVELETWGPKIQPLAEARHARVIEREKAEAQAYLAKAAAEPGAIKTESGLVYRDVRPGNGPSPKATDTVKVNYRGSLVNGTEFDSSYSRNQPAQFALNGVIRCWTEGVQRMKVGGEAVLVCPSDLAYGDRGQGSIPGGATLIFHVELLEVSAATH
jgi:FKBP-type peptidyl-prolyl cis-trans isomerase FkpA